MFFTTSSETPEEVGMSSVWLGNCENIYLNSFCFGFRPLIDFNPYYFGYLLRSDTFRNPVTILAQGISRFNISKNKVMEIEIPLPAKREQEKIGQLFYKLDTLITLHQRKLIFLKSHRFLMSVLFCYSWEQRKFSQLVLIERGGSPRPIDDFITESTEGLNWVKIGDAPSQGRYITKTAEKIKPSGLSKTREVHPGDLILSNSMSFGKPYIMGINGCIHDGWLLIRDVDNRFDLKFLCHLLGSEQMLNQYRSLAAGSTVNNLNKELVGNTVVSVPKIEVQKLLGEFFESIDNLITLHQRKRYVKLTKP